MGWYILQVEAEVDGPVDGALVEEVLLAGMALYTARTGQTARMVRRSLQEQVRKDGDAMRKKNLRRLRCLVTAQTMGSLERLARMDGGWDVGRVIDKLVREKMLSLHRPPGLCGRKGEGSGPA